MARHCDVEGCGQRAEWFRDEDHITGMPGYRSVLIRMYACGVHAQYDEQGAWIPLFWAREGWGK